ncbi:MAG: hypothetical protein AB7F31_07035 [Parachlamydiales bacterium]
MINDIAQDNWNQILDYCTPYEVGSFAQTCKAGQKVATAYIESRAKQFPDWNEKLDPKRVYWESWFTKVMEARSLFKVQESPAPEHRLQLIAAIGARNPPVALWSQKENSLTSLCELWVLDPWTHNTLLRADINPPDSVRQAAVRALWWEPSQRFLLAANTWYNQLLYAFDLINQSQLLLTDKSVGFTLFSWANDPHVAVAHFNELAVYRLTQGGLTKKHSILQPIGKRGVSLCFVPSSPPRLAVAIPSTKIVVWSFTTNTAYEIPDTKIGSDIVGAYETTAGWWIRSKTLSGSYSHPIDGYKNHKSQEAPTLSLWRSPYLEGAVTLSSSTLSFHGNYLQAPKDLQQGMAVLVSRNGLPLLVCASRWDKPGSLTTWSLVPEHVPPPASPPAKPARSYKPLLLLLIPLALYTLYRLNLTRKSPIR